MRLFVKGLSILASSVAVTAFGGLVAGATEYGEWVPTSTPPFVNPAGTVCPFEVKGDIVYDREYMRVVAAFPDGSPRVEEFVGALGIRFTNIANGKSAVRDASGALRVTHRGDGGREVRFIGNGATAIRTTNSSFPAGDYVLSGYFVLNVGPDGEREFTEQRGTIENMCHTLA